MNRRIRILHLRPSRFVGGPERQLFRYAEYENGGPVEVILGSFLDDGEGTDFLSAAQGLGFHTASFSGGTFGAIGKLRQFVRREQIALVCTHGYKADVLATAACLGTGVPTAVFLRGWIGEDPKVKMYEFLDRSLLPLANRVVCLCAAQAGAIACRPGLRNKVRVVVNAGEKRNILPEKRAQIRTSLYASLGVSAEAILIATAGRLSPEKGTADFIRAIPHIWPLVPAAKFVICGEGREGADLRALVNRLGLAEKVIFAGFLPCLPEQIAAFDLLVNPSLTEVMPNVVLEAIAAGVPVVATAVGGVPEIAYAAKGVYLTPPENPDALASAVVHALQAQSKAGGAAWVGNDFSPETQKRQLRELYSDLVPSLSFGDRTPARADAPEIESTPTTISVVLPVRNEEKRMAAVLRVLIAQRYPKDQYEIIVVDGDSRDRTREVAAEQAQQSPVPIRCLSNPARLSSAARNLGAQAARGEVIVYVDGHCHIESADWLADTARLMNLTGSDCLCRPQPLAALEGNRTAEVVAAARASSFGHAADSTIFDTFGERFLNPTSSGAVYHRSVFKRVGYFDERFDACEDLDFNYRVHAAGLLAYSSPRLTVTYQARTTYAALWKQMTRYGRGRFRFLRKHPEAISLTQLIVPGFPLALGTLLAAGVSFPICLYAAAVLAGLYSVVSLAVSAGMAFRKRSLRLLAMPVAFAAIHFGLANGFLREALATFRGGWKPVPVSGASYPGDVRPQGEKQVEAGRATRATKQASQGSL